MRTNLKKEGTLKILFSDEKIFDIDEICNHHNNRIWPVDRAGGNKNEDFLKK